MASLPSRKEADSGAAEVARAQDTKIREVLRLKAAGFSDGKIAVTIGSARSTVQECVRRAHAAGLVWPLSEDLDENALHARL